MITKIRITARNHIEHLIPSFGLLIFLIVAPYIFVPKLKDPNDIQSLCLFIFVTLGMPIVLGVLLHIRYYFNDKGRHISLFSNKVLYSLGINFFSISIYLFLTVVLND